MTRRRAKKKRMTITEMYNRYAKGLQYFGESFATKRKATRKQLNEIKKHTSKIRRELKEQGIDNVPTIAQAYKYLKEEATAQLTQMLDKPFADEIEQLDYAEQPLDMTKFEYPILEEFYTVMEDVSSESIARFGPTKPAFSIIELTTKLEEKVAQIEDNAEKKNAFADYLASSDEFANLKQSRYYDYDDILNFLDSLYENLSAIVDDFTQKSNQASPQFIPNKSIRLDI